MTAEAGRIDISINDDDLGLTIYVIHSGRLRIKEAGNFAALDGPDKKAMELAGILEESLLEEYRNKEQADGP